MPDEREIFRDLINLPGDPNTEELLVLGLYHYHKWDRILDWEERNSTQSVSPKRFLDIANGFSNEDVRRYRDVARRSMREIEHAALSSAVREGWWRGFWQSFSAAPY